MKRQVSLEEISDGKLYDRNDMVKAGCGGCRDCSACCHGMGESIVLDPLDMYRLTVGLSLRFEQLMEQAIELNVVDGIILPNLKMQAGTEQCAFLNEEGRCSIHAQRPGICRLFPLGRYYETQQTGSGTPLRTFRYFLQVHECPYGAKTKVKVSRWLDTPDLPVYEQYIRDWHYYLEDVQQSLEHASDETRKNASLYILQMFYIRPYHAEQDFYEQFNQRLQQAKEIL